MRLRHPRVFELTNINSMRDAVRSASIGATTRRRFDDAITSLQDLADLPLQPRTIAHMASTDSEPSPAAIDFHGVQRIIEFAAANEEEVRDVIYGVDEFFDAACVTRFICSATLASGKKAIVVHPAYTNTMLTGLEKPDDTSLKGSCFNFSEDADIVLIPFNSSTHDADDQVYHWTLFIADRERNALIVYDPLGNTSPCEIEFRVVRSVLQELFYDNDEAPSQSDDLCVTNCSNLKQNRQQDGTSCGLYVSELAAHYLFSGHSHCLPATITKELRAHALRTLRDLDEAYSSATGLYFTPRAKWLHGSRYSYENPSSPSTSRDSGVFVDDDHEIDSNPTSLYQNKMSTSSPASVDLLERISRCIGSRRQKIIMEKQSLSSKMNQPEPRYSYSHNTRLAEWKRNRVNIIARIKGRLATNSTLLGDLETTRVILGALWSYFAPRADYDRFMQLKSTDTNKPIQEVARFWANETDEVRYSNTT
ncbi:hypothetical protein AAVH_32611 [Aphelenchoides avenae]|nr:hypothetical protein AAVH_32611 [Aphelenchus avenae]